MMTPVYVKAYGTPDPKDVVESLAAMKDIVVDIDIKPRLAAQ